MASSGSGRWHNRWTQDDRKTTDSHFKREDRTDRIWQKVYAAEAREHEVKGSLMTLQTAHEAAPHRHLHVS